MSRVTALLGGKRNKGDGGSKSKDEGGTSSISSTPEKDRGTSSETRRDRKLSFAESIGPTGSAERTSVIRRQPSSSSIILHSTTPDGTPIVYGSTTEENASRSGRLTIEDGSANGKIRRGTFSRGGPALELPRVTGLDNGANHPSTDGSSANLPTRTMPAFQPVGEGSLSLDTLLGPSQHDAVTPKAGYLQFQNPEHQDPQHPKLFVTDASPLPSPIPGSEGLQHRRSSTTGTVQQQYPPVFEQSDMGSSSSSSTASRSERVLEAAASGTGQSAPAGHPYPVEDHRVRSMTTVSPSNSLAPPTGKEGHSMSRGRASTTAATMPSGRRSVSPSPSRSATAPVKASKTSKKGNNGIAGALALSGVAFASPAPGVAQPFQIAGPGQTPLSIQRPSPNGKRSSSGAVSNSANSNILDINRHHSHDGQQVLERRSTEEGDGFESPTPLSTYTPNDSPRYEDDPAFHAMVSMDVLGDFDDVITQIGTGYALASSKRNAEFHALFKNVPEDDYLIEDYGCALQREILIQGRLYISEHRLCFYANIFGWVTTLTLDFHEIIAIEKRNTALVIPNAILIATMHNRNTFASFISRDMTYDLIVSLWRNSHPVVPTSAALPDSAGIIEDDDDDFTQSHNEEHTGNEAETGRKKRKMRKGRFRKMKGGHKHETHTMQGENEGEEAALSETPENSKGRPSLGGASLVKSPTAIQHSPTTCNCTTSGTGHFANVVMDTTFPGSPEKLYNLMFTSGFMKDFLTKDMQLTDLQIGDWAPEKNGSHLLSRTYSYIKAINAPVGPKSTKCILTDENLHVDFDNFVVNLTTTKTPEVPSGGSFSVKTKTCFTWAKNNTTRVLVTTAVEWTGRSFIKSIVDRSSLDGQKTLYVALDSSIRKYISAHKSEFYTSGEGDDHEEVHQGVEGSSHSRNVSNASADGAVGDVNTGLAVSQPKEPLSFIADTVPYSKPLCDFLTTLWDTIADILGQMSPSTLICSFIIFALFVSNIFTLSSLRKSSSRYIPQRRPLPGSFEGASSLSYRRDGEEQDVVAAAVRGALHEYFQHAGIHAGIQRKSEPALVDTKDIPDSQEAREIWSMIETLEKRVEALKSSLQDLD